MARKAGLTRADVVEAAAVLADAGGPSAVTLSAVAAAVGVRSPSLYAHVDGLTGLRRAVALAAMVQLTDRLRLAAASEPDPGERLRALARAYRAFALQHPGRYALLLPVPRPADDPEGAATAAATVTVIAGALTDLGIDEDRHVDLVRTLRATLHGFVDLEHGGGFGLSDPVERSFEAAVDLLVAALVTARP
jgi:AcrR family transcriptional regulator